MKRIIWVLMPLLLCNISFGQDRAGAEKLVQEGVAYHDKGDYVGAISRYDKALEIDKDNLLALAEKAMSLFYLKKFDEAIDYCQKAIATHSGDEGLDAVYVTYGNALDVQKKAEKAIEIYDEGIRQFPSYYQLHFNKGVSLASVRKFDEAILCFQNAVKVNPRHASSHNAIARLSNMSEKRIPSLLAYCRFLAIEQQGNRAKENLSSVQRIMKGNVEKTGEKSVTININPDMLGDTKANGKPKENSFTSTDLVLAMSAALDLDKKSKENAEVEQFISKFETVCSSLKETKNDNYGFFWSYYVPYFIEMNEKKFLETYAYLVFASSDNSDISKWLEDHKGEIDKFFEWSNSFKWKTN